MKYRRHIINAVSLAISLFIVSCAAQTPTASIPAAGPSGDPTVVLPPQELYGLLAEVTMHVYPASQTPTHAIDVRLTNRESSSKYNVFIDQVSLGSAATSFHRSQPQTLWNRGSSINLPMAASWNLQHPLPSYTLSILVRYENRGDRAVYVPLRWNVQLDVPPPLDSARDRNGHNVRQN